MLIVVPLAFLLERTDFPMRRLMTAIVLAPMGLPGFVAAMAWILMLNPDTGVLNDGLRSLLGTEGRGPIDIYSLGGMIFVGAMLFVPSLYLMISGTFSRFDPALEDASATAGATLVTTLRRITFPLLTPALLGALVYYFMVGIDTFEVPAFIGVPGGHYTLTTWIFRSVHPPGAQLPNYGTASAFGILTIVLATGLVVSYRYVIREQARFVTVGSRGFRPRTVPLPRWLRRSAIGVLALYGIVGFVLPFAILIWHSLVPPFTKFGLSSFREMSLENYTSVLAEPTVREAIVNTLVMAFAASILTMALAVLVAWFGLRDANRTSAVSQVLIFVTLGVPGVIIGVSTMLVYLWLPVGIYGTIWIIVLAMVVRFLPYGTMVVTPALMQVGRDLEDASAVSGAPWWRTLTKIVLPIIWPSCVRGGLWTFVHAARDATIVLVLMTAGNVMLGSYLWAIWFQEGNFAKAAAVSVLLALVSSALTFLLVRFDPIANEANS
jgi:iron(III) transport system permease protein